MTIGKGAHIQLQFRPSALLISSARQFVADFYEHVVGDAAALSRIVLAIDELLENAVKYAADGVTEIRIDVIETASPRVVRIKMSNKANAAHRDVLKRTVDATGSAVDPLRHYRDVMLKNARRKDGAGLGLARIRAEADMRMNCTIDGDEVSILVEADLPPRQAAFAGSSA